MNTLPGQFIFTSQSGIHRCARSFLSERILEKAIHELTALRFFFLTPAQSRIVWFFADSSAVFSGEVSEWSMVHAWKACVQKCTAGSNPALSEVSYSRIHQSVRVHGQIVAYTRFGFQLLGSRRSFRTIEAYHTPPRFVWTSFRFR